MECRIVYICCDAGQDVHFWLRWKWNSLPTLLDPVGNTGAKSYVPKELRLVMPYLLVPRTFSEPWYDRTVFLFGRGTIHYFAGLS